MPLISIIVPIYRVEAYLRRCVDSVLAQTFQDFEIILVDDGSPDNCGAICDEYAADDERVLVIHKNNGGVSSARNAGLDVATGLYVMFVDSDDTIVPEFLASALKAVQDHQLDIYLAGLAETKQTGEVLYMHTIPEVRFSGSEKLCPDLFVELLRANYIASSCAKLYSRSLIGNTRFDTTLCYGEDLKFVWTILLKSPKIMASPEVGYLYLENPNSVTHYTPTAEKYISVVRTNQFIFSYDETYWGRPDIVFRSFCQNRWQADYVYFIRQITEADLPVLKKFALLSIMYSDSDLRHHLSAQSYKSYNPYWLWFKFKTKRGLRQVINVLKSAIGEKM